MKVQLISTALIGIAAFLLYLSLLVTRKLAG
jgi:hypothetical protein